MPKRRKDRPRQTVPARRASHSPAREARGREPARYVDPPAAHASQLPMPEFLSLTYTLPYHLIRQMEEVARDSNRSQSEVIAEAIRLYLRTVEARREHTRISTVEGFSYQEVAVAETYVERDSHDLGPEPAPHGRVERDRVDDEDQEEWDDEDDWEEEDDDEEWDDEDWEEGDGEEEDDDEEGDDGGEDDPYSGGDSVGDDVEAEPAPVPAPREDPGAAARQEDRSAAAPAVGPEPIAPAVAEASPRDTGETAADATTEEDAAAPPAQDEKRTVAIATETREGEALDPLVDPAAEVRRRLRKISGEPLGSMAMRSALADIVSEIDRKDYSPEDHSQKVAELARELGKARGLSGDLLLQLEMAALVHDLGKASVPADILEKRRPSPEEMAVIRQYPEFGADLLEIVPSMAPLKRLVATHQERWNGSGYPDGLQGGDIPVGAQIIALCDVYNVLTTERRYRPAYSEDRARQIIRQNIGTLWNQEIARTFLKQVIGDEED